MRWIPHELSEGHAVLIDVLLNDECGNHSKHPEFVVTCLAVVLQALAMIGH